MDEFGEYDYLESVVFDIHCAPKGRLVARQRVESVLKNGMGMYGAICNFGIQQDVNCHDRFGADRNFGNLLLHPIPETLTPVLPCVKGRHKVGQVLCSLKDFDGSVEATTPRYVVEKQVEALSAMGYWVRSSFELEFALYHADTGKPFGHDKLWGNIGVIEDNQEIFLDFIEELKVVGIKADTLQTEAGSGQYEMTLDVTEGVRVADMAVRFKNAARKFFRKRGLTVCFMTKDQLQGFSHGFHYNHSLWTNYAGKSVFADLNDPEKLSVVGRHWLAGLITHVNALTALCCPTVNCYRRLHNPFVPSIADWCREKRNASFRLKVEGKDNVYLENRIPSSACNPYIVMAGVLAAGMDGIKRKLSLEEVDCQQELPWSLESALKALEEDTHLVEALGKDFVDMYGYVKRTYEIEPLQGCSEEEKFAKEYEMYFANC